MSTIMEEKRGLMGRNTSLTNDIMEGRLLIGISNSITAIMDTDSTELLKYCPVGLTGSNPSSNSIICNEITQDKGKQFLLHRFLLFFFYEFLASQVVAYVPPAWENTHTHTHKTKLMILNWTMTMISKKHSWHTQVQRWALT